MWEPKSRFVPLAWYADDLASPDPILRAKAAHALDLRARNCDVANLLLPVLDDPSPEVRRWAVAGIVGTYKGRGRSLEVPIPVLQKAFDRRLGLETNRRVLNQLFTAPDALFASPDHQEKARAAFNAALDW
jgi:hypothetical protein